MNDFKTTPARNPSTIDWLNTVLEEYKTLRTETLEAGKLAQTTLQIGFIGVGVMMTAVINKWDNPIFVGLIMLFFPFFLFCISFIWLGELDRRMRIGKYIYEVIEPKVNGLFESYSLQLFFGKHI